jgi:hypothetical protein
VSARFSARVAASGCAAATLVAALGDYHASGGGGDAPGMLITSSLPQDGSDRDKAPDDGWKLSARNTSSSAGTAFAHAVCLR